MAHRIDDGGSSQVLTFCESDNIPELAAYSWRHWTAESFTVKMISSSRLKPHGTDRTQWQYNF